MIDIRDNIKANVSLLIPNIMVRLLNSTVEKRISKEEFLEILKSDGDLYEERIIDYINESRKRKADNLNDILDTYGTEYCSFILMNILLSEMAGENNTGEISFLLEMQLFTAVSSYMFAKKTKIAYSNLAYMSGLLSNISYFYMEKFHNTELLNLMRKEKNVIKRMNFEWETFGIDHAEISYRILGSARIMPEIYTPVRYHHQKNLQENLGSDSVKDISLSVYFGSLLTNLFYEDFNIAADFRKDIKILMGLSSNDLENIIDEIVEMFKREAKSIGLTDLLFPGYFKIISWYDTKIAMINSELDIAERKISELNLQNLKFQKALEDNNKKLVGIALKDPLTGAFNRRYLDERLHDEFLKAKRYGQSFFLISCDIDHFKNINDSYGHAFGDIVLIKIVQLIQSSIRKTDYIARTGGEEFIVVCHSSNELGGIIIAEKMRKIIETSSFAFEGKNVPVTMSFGVVDYFPEVKSVEELVRISDDRLYAAKNAGRNKVVYK